MTSERMIQDFAEWLFLRDNPDRGWPGVDGEPSYMIEAQIFLAGELGQQLQHGDRNHDRQLQARVDATWKNGV
jgi:hypothetical protein